MISVIIAASTWAIPLLLFFIPAYSLWKGVDIYEEFVRGATEGFYTALRLVPYLITILAAITIFNRSGAMDLFIAAVSPLVRAAGIPVEVIPLALLRPLSGTGALGMLTVILNEKGPDSYIGVLASTMMGSTETTFYIITVYFGAVGVTRPRHSLLAGLIADLAGFIAAILITNLIFSHL